MPEPSHVSISVLFQRQEPKRFIGSLRDYVPKKKRLKKPPDLLGSVLPKCAHSLGPRIRVPGENKISSQGPRDKIFQSTPTNHFYLISVLEILLADVFLNTSRLKAV